MSKNGNQKNGKMALVTGANRGLGFGCTHELLKRGYTVIATARDLKKLKDVAAKNDWPGDRTHLMELDTSNEESILKFEKEFSKMPEANQLEILVNNAGVYLDPKDGKTLSTSPENFMKTLQTNVYGPFRLCQIVLPTMMKNNSGRIVNVSSGMGQLSEMESGYEAYRVSKTALNSLTRVLASDLSSTKIKVNSVCPGWVRTDMGGPSATRPLEDGVASILWAAFIPDTGPTGGFFRDGKPLEW